MHRMWLCAGKLGVPGVLLSEYAPIVTNLLSWNVSLFQGTRKSEIFTMLAGTLWPLHQRTHDATCP